MTRLDELLREVRAANDLQEARMICAACGEVIYEGPLEEGRLLMSKHRQEFHPDLARAEVVQRRARKAVGARRIDLGVGNPDRFRDRYARELAAARRDARLAESA